MPDVSLPGPHQEELESTRQGSYAELGQNPAIPGNPTDNRIAEDAVDLERELSNTYSSDSTGSEMDESSDSSSTDSSTSDSRESSQEPNVPDSERSLDGGMENPDVDEQENEHRKRTLSEHAQVSTDDQAGDGERQVSPAVSASSEGYEPPEPDSGSVDSEYSPLSPIVPGREESDVSRIPHPDQSQSDEPLTGNIQELGADSTGHVQVGPLEK